MSNLSAVEINGLKGGSAISRKYKILFGVPMILI